MKLQLALIFGEHMLLQRNREIPVWGKSARDDTITVTLGSNTVTTIAVKGEWKVFLPAMEACERTTMSVKSEKTGEQIVFTDVAVGEVWLAGGQSNMEFLLKYDYNAEEMKQTENDHQLRFFCYPQTAFLGFMEKENCEDWGFWRCWEEEEDRVMFSAISAYMGRILREKLNVPVGIVGCNWGGTPAAAWTAMEDLEANEKLKPVLDWYNEGLEKINWRKYITSSEMKNPEPDSAGQEIFEKMMMGEDISQYFANRGPMPMPDPDLYNTYMCGPRGTTRPAGLYDNMLTKVAPYPIQGVIWYQGEDDDAKDWVDFYDESLVTMINSWRKLWKYDFIFLQVELAPFEGKGFSISKHYDRMRHKQAEAAARLENVYDICILDIGDQFNIHARRKKLAGKRLADLAMKYVYGESSLVADCPRAVKAERKGNQICVIIDNSAEGLYLKEGIEDVLFVKDKEENLAYTARCENNLLIIEGDFENKEKLRIEFCESNWCVDPLFNSEDNPVYGFTFEV